MGEFVTNYDGWKVKAPFHISSKELDAYFAMVPVAAGAHATPDQSGYHVLGAGILTDGTIVPGSNHEYSITRAIHGEESIVANALEQGLDKPLCPTESFPNKLEAILFAGQSADGSPCGNCRDVLQRYMAPDGLYIGADTENKVMVIQSISDFYATPSKLVDKEVVDEEGLELAWMTMLKNYNRFIADTTEDYAAVIVTKDGQLFQGSFRSDISYHPTLPVQAAIAHLDSVARTKDAYNIKEVIISGTHSIPYLERQHLVDLYGRNEFLHGENAFPVYFEKDMKIVASDPVSLLPNRFYFHDLEQGRLEEWASRLE